MRPVRTPLLIFALALVGASSASAADPRHEVGAFIATVSPSGSLDTNLTVGGDTFPGSVDLESTSGFGLSYQYRLKGMLGLGATLLWSSHDVYVSSAPEEGVIGKAAFTPLLLDANFHLLKRSQHTDFWVGPTVGYAMWGDLKPDAYATEFGITESQKLKDNFVYGANIGVGFRFQNVWALDVGLRYLRAKAEADNVGPQNIESIDVNPWIVSIGVSYKF